MVIMKLMNVNQELLKTRQISVIPINEEAAVDRK